MLLVADEIRVSPLSPLSRTHRYLNAGAGLPPHLPGEHVSASPGEEGSMPSTRGGASSVGLLPATTSVLLLRFDAVPALFVAVTSHPSEWPWSSLATLYVGAVADLIPASSPPPPRSH